MKENSGDDAEDINFFFKLLSNLQKEKLFVSSEKQSIQKLNTRIKNKLNHLIQSTWITTKQRLYLLTQREFLSDSYQHINAIGRAEFVEAKTVLGFPETIKIENLLHILRTHPEQLAKWIYIGEEIPEQCPKVMQSIVTGLYASCLFPEDTNLMLKVLYELAKLQLVKDEHPRKMLKQGTCSFRNLYFTFNEVVPTAKFFLSAALEMPILRLLSHRQFHLDTDPDKSLMRYRHNENNLRQEFKTVQEYRAEVIVKLASLTNYFIQYLRENVYSFPRSVAWIVYKISKIISKQFGTKEANAVVSELMFTLYICPAIVDPEQYSICDAQITDIARHNLIQVGQILQILALNKYEPPDQKLRDIYELLDQDAVSGFMEDVLFTLENEDKPPVDITPVCVVRDRALFAEDELKNLVAFLQRVHTEIVANDKWRVSLSLGGSSIEDQVASLMRPSPLDSSPKSSKSFTNGFSESPKRSNLFSLVTKNNNHFPKSKEGDDLAPMTVLIFSLEQEIVAPLGLISEDKVIKMNLPSTNDQIFQHNNGNAIKISSNGNNNIDHLPPEMVGGNDGGEDEEDGDVNGRSDDKPPYSNYHDEGSIGNTSDNLEAISEAASNHSVASSIELENEDQNDNLSDMISANVSGRGSPNISGRDTPSSQVNEEERPLPEARQAELAQPRPQISRQIRSEIDDKFCKFEIKKLLEGDETISIISETWSTDVLASDNETVDAGDSRMDRQALHLMDQAIMEVPNGTNNILDISETQSESAWSTDVMASDSERMTEVDNDDAASVAQSDETGSVARFDDARSETDENAALPPPAPGGSRRSSQSSNPYVNHVNYVNYQEYSSSSSTTTRKMKTDSNANNVLFKSVESHMHNSTTSSGAAMTFAELKTTTYNSNGLLRGLPLEGNHSSVNGRNKDCGAGPSGSGVNNSDLLLRKGSFDDRPSEILLSNCSLNSSSSGSSSNSFENNNNNNPNNKLSGSEWESKQWLNSSGSSLNVTSTPSESTSELSVLSVTNLNNPAGANMNNMAKRSATVGSTRGLKPSASTGAIPKSISFDMSADKGDKYLDMDHRSKRGGFFGKLRMGFSRNRRGKSFRHQDDYQLDGDEFGSEKKAVELKMNNAELSEDILAKYRTKPFAHGNLIKDEQKSPDKVHENGCSQNKHVDVNNSFDDMKRKLRLVLGDTNSQTPKVITESRLSVKSKIETILRLELGKARSLKEWSSIARISEALRFIHLLSESTCLNLLQSMHEDFLRRSIYTQYLISSRQDLLFCHSYLEGLSKQVNNEKRQCEEYLCMMCLRSFLLEQEVKIVGFCNEFKGISMSDEKCDFLDHFYSDLYAIMKSSELWMDMLKNEDERDKIRMTLERCIMSKVYLYALYPNGDGDRDRDQVLYQHIKKLAKIITPNHKDLMIHQTFLREFPWIPAQDALNAMSAYRTPRDKVNCVTHCAMCIMDLLSFSQNTGSTTADDFTPVLVYVIIRVNPVDLMSTIQFVNSFYQNKLCGEELYWWTQFCSAVEYIKTMDYSN